MVAHNAPFDRRVLRQAFDRIGLEWPNPPVLCTAALARTLLPLQRRRGLGVLADALGIEVDDRAPGAGRRRDVRAGAVRAVPAAVRQRAHDRATRWRCWRHGAGAPAEPPSSRVRGRRRRPRAAASSTSPSSPSDPGVYLFRDGAGQIAVRRQVGLDPQPRPRPLRAVERRRPAGPRTPTVVDYRTHELGARRAGAREPPDQGARAAGQHPPDPRATTGSCYIRCRLDIPFPILEVVARAGRRATRSRSARCAGGGWRSSWSSSSTRCSGCATAAGGCRGASTRRRTGRWAAACRRAWATWTRTCTAAGSTRRWGCSSTRGDGRPRLLDHVEAPDAPRPPPSSGYERAAWLRRRAARLAAILDRLGRRARGHPRPAAAGARPAPVGPERRTRSGWPAGRLVDWGPVAGATGRSRLRRAREAALRRAARAGELGAHVPPDEVDEMRIVADLPRLAPRDAAAGARPAAEPGTLRRL